MKKLRNLVSILLSLVLLVSISTTAMASAYFVDVPDNAWYSSAVDFVYENEIFNGTGNGKFSPDAYMTRAMFVQVLANKTENYDKSDWINRSQFSDVNAKQWYAAPIEWASTAEIINGMGNGKFAPNVNITREQLVTVLYNYAKKTDNDISYNSVSLSSFADSNKVSSWAKDAMLWAVAHGVINGSNGKINPKSYAKRSEVAQIMMNVDFLLVNTYVDAEPTPTLEDGNYSVTIYKDGLNNGSLSFDLLSYIDMTTEQVSKIKVGYTVTLPNGISFKVKNISKTTDTILFNDGQERCIRTGDGKWRFAAPSDSPYTYEIGSYTLPASNIQLRDTYSMVFGKNVYGVEYNGETTGDAPFFVLKSLSDFFNYYGCTNTFANITVKNGMVTRLTIPYRGI